MRLRDIDIKSHHGYSRKKEFNFGTHCISSQYLDNLLEVSTSGIAKAIVQLDEVAFSGEPFELNGSIVKVHRLFDFNTYWEQPKQLRKTMLLETLHNGMMTIAKIQNWPMDSFAHAYEKVVSSGIVNKKRWRKTIVNQSDTLTAQLETVFDQESIVVNAIFSDFSGRHIACSELTSLMPHDLFLDDALGDFRWISDKCVMLESKDKAHHWNACA